MAVISPDEKRVTKVKHNCAEAWQTSNGIYEQKEKGTFILYVIA